MTTRLTEEELAEYGRYLEEPDDDRECLRCHLEFTVAPGDEPTSLCHDCAHEAIERLVPKLLDAAAALARLEAENEKLRAELSREKEFFREMNQQRAETIIELLSLKEEHEKLRAERERMAKVVGAAELWNDARLGDFEQARAEATLAMALAEYREAKGR